MGPTAGEDLALLRRHEPVVRYTAGELFAPIAVGPYVARCSLRAGGRSRTAEPLVPEGRLTLERLGEVGRRYRDRPLHLQFVQRPLPRPELRQWWRQDRPRLRGAARLAAVGAGARLVDVLVRLSLLVRGRVPGGLVAAAHRRAVPDLSAGGPTYYGRVVRDGGYVVLQYWFFYAFNDWRSSFHGVNDHEGDWETVTVYLVPDGDGPRPVWVAASAHDHRGEVLRRRWDDPQLAREGEHPVLFAGAGSHAHAFLPGDHVVSVALPPLRRLVGHLQRVRRAVLPWSPEPVAGGGFSIPFVDYARGDGPVVGPGHGPGWTAETIDDATPWVRDFRGLWGLDTRDALGGERAPAGPRYERDGTLRVAWSDPLAWAGLDTVAPTADAEAEALRTRIAELDGRLAALDGELAAGRAAARSVRAQARSLGRHADTRGQQRARLGELHRRQAEVAALSAERARLADERTAHLDFLAHPPDPDPPDAHLPHPALPRVAFDDWRAGFLRVWAAVSTPFLILGIGALLARPTPGLLAGFAAFLVVFAAVEAVARRRLIVLVRAVAVTVAGLAVAVGLVLALLRGWQYVLAAVLIVGALGLLLVNLREFRRG